jgi:hypothetical protein
VITEKIHRATVAVAEAEAEALKTSTARLHRSKTQGHRSKMAADLLLPMDAMKDQVTPSIAICRQVEVKDSLMSDQDQQMDNLGQTDDRKITGIDREILQTDGKIITMISVHATRAKRQARAARLVQTNTLRIKVHRGWNRTTIDKVKNVAEIIPKLGRRRDPRKRSAKMMEQLEKLPPKEKDEKSLSIRSKQDRKQPREFSINRAEDRTSAIRSSD